MSFTTPAFRLVTVHLEVDDKLGLYHARVNRAFCACILIGKLGGDKHVLPWLQAELFLGGFVQIMISGALGIEDWAMKLSFNFHPTKGSFSFYSISSHTHLGEWLDASRYALM